jgi:hypothetical protein
MEVCFHTRKRVEQHSNGDGLWFSPGGLKMKALHAFLLGILLAMDEVGNGHELRSHAFVYGFI